MTLTHNTGGPVLMLYDGTSGSGADTRVVPPSIIVPESLMGWIGLAALIPIITGRRRLLVFLRIRR